MSPHALAARLALAVALGVGLTLSAVPATAQEASPEAGAMGSPMASPMAGMTEATPTAAQGATPMAGEALDVPLIDASGEAVGLATFSETGEGVSVALLIEGLTPGEHGWHLHEFGICDPEGDEPFSSAGGHWNPTGQPHGAPDAAKHHAGDFGNLVATADGLAELEFTTTDFTLGEGVPSVFDEDGTAIIVHEGMDDLTTQPSGNSGPRYACGVVAEPAEMPEEAAGATPMAMASPVGAASPVAEASPVAGASPVSG